MTQVPFTQRIAVRLALWFSLSLFLMISGTWFALSHLRDSRDTMLGLVDIASIRAADLYDMRHALEQEDYFAEQMNSDGRSETARQCMAGIDAEVAEYARAAAHFEMSLATEADEALIRQTYQYGKATATSIRSAKEQVVAGHPEVAAEILDHEMLPLHNKWLQALDDLARIQRTRVVDAIRSHSESHKRTEALVKAIAAIAASVAALGAWHLTSSITRPLRQAVAFANAVGRGELHTSIPNSRSDEPGRLLTALRQMADQLQRADGELKRQSIEDGLTGAFNRRHFDAILRAEHERATRAARHGPHATKVHLSLLMIDVDHFKLFNDEHGHPAGDSCLRTIVEAIRLGTGRSGDHIARYGGEEFAVILPACPIDTACLIAEQIRLEVAAMSQRSQNSLLEGVSVSIGVATLHDDFSLTSEDLIRSADSALYMAKSSGRNRVSRSNIRREAAEPDFVSGSIGIESADPLAGGF